MCPLNYPNPCGVDGDAAVSGTQLGVGGAARGALPMTGELGQFAAQRLDPPWAATTPPPAQTPWGSSTWTGASGCSHVFVGWTTYPQVVVALASVLTSPSCAPQVTEARGRLSVLLQMQ